MNVFIEISYDYRGRKKYLNNTKFNNNNNIDT